MSIICPSCGSSLNQITNTHIRAKHPEFNSVTEFKEYFNLETLWSEKVKSSFIKTMTGRSRDPYILTEKYFTGIKQGSAKRSGENHWNFGKHWNDDDKTTISNGVKSSSKFQQAMSRWEEEDYRSWRMTIINDVVLPNQLKTRAERGKITAFEDKSEWDQYKALVNKYTRQSLTKYNNMIDPSNLLESDTYNLDHMFSKFEGFKQGIPPEIIGSPVNLTPLDWIKNRQKSRGCSITKEELLSKYSEFIASGKSTKPFKSRKS